MAPEDRKGHSVTNPIVIVEVLSPGTAAYDRGEKLEHYKRIPSLQDIVLVAHDEPLIEVYSRTGEPWTRREARRGAIALPSISCELAIDAVYRDPLASVQAQS